MVSMKQTRLGDERSRALALLAERPDGCTRAVLLARGFSLALLNQWVRAGLASHLDRQEHREKTIEIVRVKVTEAGRRALRGAGVPPGTPDVETGPRRNSVPMQPGYG